MEEHQRLRKSFKQVSEGTADTDTCTVNMRPVGRGGRYTGI